MYFRELVFILLLLTVSSSIITENLPLDLATGVLISMKQYWRVHCIYLIQHPGTDEATKFTNSLLKTLSKVGIRAAVLSEELLETTFNTTKCTRNLPLYVIPYSGSEVKQALQKVSERTSLSKARWLLFLQRTNETSFFPRVYVPYDCEFLIVKQSGGGIMVLSEVYRLYTSGPLWVFKVAHWSTRTGLIWTASEFNQRRQDLQGMIIRATAISDGNVVIGEVNGRLKLVGGYVGKIWQLLETSLNFTTDIRKPSDGLFGSQMENLQWNGMVGAVHRGEAEIGIGSFSITRSRSEVVDYLAPIVNEKLIVIVQQPEVSDSSRNLYSNSFESDLWNTILGFWILISTYFWLISCASAKTGLLESDERRNIVQIILIVFGCFCYQGINLNSKNWSLRITIFVTYITALVIVASYFATFTSYLTVRHPELPFTTFQELLHHKSYDFGVLKGSAQLSFFESSTDAVVRRIYTRLIAPHKESLPTTELAGLRRVCEREQYAYMCGLIILNRAKERLKCNLVPITRAFIPVTLAMIIRKNSPFRRAFTHRIQTMRRLGHLEGILRSVMTTRPSTKETDNEISITFQDIIPVLRTLGLGILLALFFLIAEIIIHRKR